MPTTTNNGTEIYYEVHGEGEPLLLIMGLSHNALSWNRTWPALAEKYQVILFDNRGTGRSAKPQSSYSIELMADDAKAVLDAVEVDKVHVYGISMGGMIAQKLAINYPDRVQSLILGCTTAGGATHIQPSPDVSMLMISRASVPSTPEEIAWAVVPILYSETFIENNHSDIAEDIKTRIEIPTPVHGYMLQLQACLAHDTSTDLEKITVPTLVIHGDADKLVPYENGVTLASRIKNAELFTVPGAGHIYVTEAADIVNNKVLQFLQNQ
ncbi:alpha/beta hydrolase [Bacillus sp. HMF5848]|uniref:alpha/beta fold hydrolase n=1 Tax=Bacillus sp. HMF5848 TaxID=2495421 RepID=UPI000F774AA7|nr:alpha/beta hydrolase [Bacillus sp. HMF5848]RSK26622.1 alpha/beta hydrolase [Bacillus sp. HMF5848]